MATDRLRIVRHYDNLPSFNPRIIGFYGIDENRQFLPSSKNLKYVYRPNVKAGLDLNHGFDIYIPRTETLENEERIESLLRWIYHSKYLRTISESQELECTFISFRGVLTTIMRTPYEKQEDWFISAIKEKNIIFLCAFYTDNKKIRIQREQVPWEQRCEYWGRKFEQYLLTDDPNVKPDISKPVNANEEFALVFRTKMNNHDLIYGAETDGISCQKFSNPDSQLMTANPPFIELKTSRIIKNAHQKQSFERFKALKWWCQSFVVGIQDIICGFRNDDGIISNVEYYKTSNLPKIAQHWNSCVCLRFLDDFLNFVKSIMKNEADMAQWRFDWKPGKTEVTAQKMTPCRQYEIIPDWFLSEIKNFTASCD